MNVSELESNVKVYGAIAPTLLSKIPLLANYPSSSLVSGLLDNAGKVLIPEVMSVAGLGNYNTQSGTPIGPADIERIEYSLRNNRAREIRLDADDVRKQGSFNVVKAVLDRLIDNAAVEIDAQGFSRAAEGIMADDLNNGRHSIAEANADSLVDMILDAQKSIDIKEAGEPTTVFVNRMIWNYLINDKRIANGLTFQGSGAVNAPMTVASIGGMNLVAVPPKRFKTGIVLGDDGFSHDASSHNINFLILGKDAFWHHRAVMRMDITDKDQNWTNGRKDWYSLATRIVYDSGIIQGYRDACFVSLAPAVVQNTRMGSMGESEGGKRTTKPAPEAN